MTARSNRVSFVGSVLFLAMGIAGAGAIHHGIHGVWFWGCDAAARSDGWTTWNQLASASPIERVWGETPNDVWAWGEGSIIHWDGRRWSNVGHPPVGGKVAALAEADRGVWVRLQYEFPGHTMGCISYAGTIKSVDWLRQGDHWTQLEPGSGIVPPPLPPARASPSEYVGPGELARLWSPHAAKLGAPVRPTLLHGHRFPNGEIWAVDTSGLWLVRFDGRRSRR